MKVTFLGTGTSQGVPVIACECKVCQSDDTKDKRLRSSILIESELSTIMVDAGPDFRQQLLRENVKNMDAILITHAHKDHTGGLDDVRAFNYKNNAHMDVYAEKDVQHALRNEYHYVFTEFKYPGVPDVNLCNIDEDGFRVKDIDILPIRLIHHKLPVYGFKFKDFTYITDANYIEPSELEKLKGTKILIINALRKEEHISHFNLSQALEIIEKVKPQKAYLTHMGHEIGFHEEEQKLLPENVFFAYDGLSFEI